MKKLVTISQFADERSLNPRTVREWLKLRIIPSLKVRRVVLIDPVKADLALEAFERK